VVYGGNKEKQQGKELWRKLREITKKIIMEKKLREIGKKI
jgi:hypothetical protein